MFRCAVCEKDWPAVVDEETDVWTPPKSVTLVSKTDGEPVYVCVSSCADVGHVMWG